MPSTPETQEKFGIQNLSSKNRNVVLARISEAFDPLNHINIDACIEPYKSSEHDMMIQHLNYLHKGDLAIMDRGYPAFWVYKLFYNRAIDFCIRVQAKGRGKIIEGFAKSEDIDSIIEFKDVSFKSKQKCKDLNIETSSIECRLIKIELKSGETEILITSLLDKNEFPYGYFEELYHLRWPVEEDYKTLKYRLEIENFSGLSVDAIVQDFFAKIFLANLTSILSFDASIELIEKFKHRKYDYNINRSNAIKNMKNSIFLVFIRKKYLTILYNLHQLFMVKPVPYRPERTFERKKYNNKRLFSMCYR